MLLEISGEITPERMKNGAKATKNTQLRLVIETRSNAIKSNIACDCDCEVAQSCPTLCDPMDCSLPGSSVHGIFQAIFLEWIAISFSRGSKW